MNIKLKNGWICDDLSIYCTEKYMLNRKGEKTNFEWCGVSTRDSLSKYGKTIKFFPCKKSNRTLFNIAAAKVGDIIEYHRSKSISTIESYDYRLKGVITSILDNSISLDLF